MQQVKANERYGNIEPVIHRFLPYLLILVACVGMYAHCLFYGLSNHDDTVMVIESMDYLKDITNISTAFVTDAWHGRNEIELYRPLQSVTFIISAQFGNNVVFTNHLFNLLLHVLSCLALYKLLMMLQFNTKLAMLGGLIYSVHYLFLHTVIWIPARGDLLLALFTFLCFITLIKMTDNGHWKNYMLHLLCFGGALFSKETAVMLPLLFALFFCLFSKRELWQKNPFILLIGYFSLEAVFFILRSMAISKTESSLGISFFITNLPMIPETIAKFFAPVNFSTLPAFHTTSAIIGTLMIIGFCLFSIFYKRYFNKMTIFSLFWFFLLIFPGMIYRPDFAWYSYDYLDHRSYVICFGLLLIVLNIASIAGAENKKFFWCAGATVLIYLAVLNFYFSGSYKSPMTYSERALRANPRSGLAYFIHSVELFKEGNLQGALNDYDRILEINPRYPDALRNRAIIYIIQKRYDQALADLNLLLKVDRKSRAATYQLRGKIKEQQKDYLGSRKDFEAAAALNNENI